MAETNDNINDLIEQITCNMLLNDVEFNYLDNKDEKQKARRKKIHDEKKEEIGEVIKALCTVVEKQLPPGIPAPVGLNVLIARRMLFEMKDSKNVTKELSNLDAKTLLNDLKVVPVTRESSTNFETRLIENIETKAVADIIQNNDEKTFFIDTSCFMNLSDMKVDTKEGVEDTLNSLKENGGFVDSNGVNVVLHDKEYPDDGYTEEQNKTNDIIKLGAQYLTDIYQAKDEKTRQENEKKFNDLFNNSDINLKIDARIQFLIDEFNIAKIDYNGDFVKNEISRWSNEFKNNPEYDFDAHAAGSVLKFLSVVNQKCDPERKMEMFDIVRQTCPKIYDLFKQTPDIVDAMSSNKPGSDFVSEWILDGKKTGTLEDFYQGIDKFLREHSPDQIKQMAINNRRNRNIEIKEDESILPGVSDSTIDQERPEPERDKTQLTMAEKMENVKKNIIDIAKAKGATAALKFANNLIMNRSGEEREAITASVIEVVSRDEFIETAKEDDLGTIREIIGGCLDEDNKKQNPQLIDYVQALGGVSKDIKSRVKVQEMTVDADIKSVGAQQPSRDDDEPEL